MSVGAQVAPLTGPEVGSDHLVWHFLVVVRPGPARVVCSMGDISSVKSIETKTGEISVINFCFGKPVVSSNVKNLPKVRTRRRLHERPGQADPSTVATTITTKDAVKAVS